MDKAEEKIYLMALGLIPGIGSANARQLISYCGSATDIFKKSKNQLLKIPGVGPSLVNLIKNNNNSSCFDRAEQEYQFCLKQNISILAYYDEKFPKRLLQCKDAPYLIYTSGNADFNRSKVLSIVGTRRATNYGKHITNKIIEDLAPYNVTIVSGLAYGIDGIAHKKSLETNLSTVGVLAHGLDIIYPPLHRNLAKDIVQNKGALITEFMSQTIPDKQNFPSRNRIVAGMTDATIVIESAEKGGSLITADIAQSYHRDVFAVPGRVNDEYSKGCNNLIKNNIAGLINSGKDVAEMLGWELDQNKQPKHQQRSLFVELDKDEQQVVSFLENSTEAQHVDDINQKIQLPNSSVMVALLNLELKGVVLSKPGSCYELIN